MGRLNRVIEIEHFTVTRDSFGGEIKAWVTLAKVWAEKLQLKPDERFIKTSDITVNTSTVQFRFLQRDDLDLDETMRVIDDYGVKWGIVGILKNGRQFVTLQLKKAP